MPLEKLRESAIDAVARHVGATWEAAEGNGPDAYISLGGEWIDVDVAVIGQRVGRGKPRLRFDRVALRLVGALRAALTALIPDGMALMLTVTAPIRLPAKTAAGLEITIRDRLATLAPEAWFAATIRGNRLRARLVSRVSSRVAKVVGLVHNPDIDGDAVLELMEALLQSISTAVDKRLPEDDAGDRWLVVVEEHAVLSIEAYRQICGQMVLASDFNRILMVRADGRVESLFK